MIQLMEKLMEDLGFYSIFFFFFFWYFFLFLIFLKKQFEFQINRLAYFQTQQYEKAVETYEKAISMEPGNAKLVSDLKLAKDKLSETSVKPSFFFFQIFFFFFLTLNYFYLFIYFIYFIQDQQKMKPLEEPQIWVECQILET